MSLNNMRRYIIGIGLILLVPLVAMVFTDEVDWDLRDFISIGILLIGAAFVFELVTSRLNTKYRPIVAAIIIVSVFLIWAELAVGIFGSPFAGS